MVRWDSVLPLQWPVTHKKRSHKLANDNGPIISWWPKSTPHYIFSHLTQKRIKYGCDFHFMLTWVALGFFFKYSMIPSNPTLRLKVACYSEKTFITIKMAQVFNEFTPMALHMHCTWSCSCGCLFCELVRQYLSWHSSVWWRSRLERGNCLRQ